MKQGSKRNMKKHFIIMQIAVLAIVLSACGNDANQNNSVPNNANNAQDEMPGMDHSSSEETSAGLKDATDPKFKVGSQAVIGADHMPGMNGAKATIVGAYDTIVYSVSYTPTTGGAKVTNHKWVIQEDIKDAGETPFKPGDSVVLEANHMQGMEGATAQIDTAEQTTVYMVDYMPTTGGEMVKNHKWLTESELIAE